MTDRDRLIELLQDSEIKYAQHLYEECDKAIKGDITKQLFKRLEFYADYLLANGVIVLPCKLNQTMWRVLGKNIDKCKVSGITQKADGSFKIRLTHSRYRSVFEITPDRIGEDVFLTKEEAEEKLKELNDNA